jgi:hypothetical protein
MISLMQVCRNPQAQVSEGHERQKGDRQRPPRKVMRAQTKNLNKIKENEAGLGIILT